MSIIDAIMTHLQSHLEYELIDNIDLSDASRAGVVKVGPLQGDPDVDVARISAELYYNDPADEDDLHDEIIEWEMPRTAIWARWFTVLWRCLLVDSGEGLMEAKTVATTFEQRLIHALGTVSWTGVEGQNYEQIIGCPLEYIRATKSQGGGPNEYDWQGKIQFSVLTSEAFR